MSAMPSLIPLTLPQGRVYDGDIRWFISVDLHGSPLDPQPPFCKEPNRLGKDFVLKLQNPIREGLLGIIGQHGTCRLNDHRSSIHPLIDEMDCAAADPGTVLQGLFLTMKARERR